jgi:hypothetical protein
MGGIPYLVGTADPAGAVGTADAGGAVGTDDPAGSVGTADAAGSTGAGWIVEPTIDAMAGGLKAAHAGAGALATTARLRYEQSFAPDVLVERLLDIYREVAG